jgi:hypothetical protein
MTFLVVLVACGNSLNSSREVNDRDYKPRSGEYKCKDNDQAGVLEYSYKGDGKVGKPLGYTTFGDPLGCEDSFLWRLSLAKPSVEIKYLKAKDLTREDDIFKDAEAVMSVSFTNVNMYRNAGVEIFNNYAHMIAKEKIINLEGSSQWLIALKSKRKFVAEWEGDSLRVTIR